jgi:hypothetical protein
MSIFDYKGPRGRLKDVEVIYEAGRYDGPLSGVCRVEDKFLYFGVMKFDQLSGGDLYIPYNDTYGWSREQMVEECKEFNETPEEYIEDMDVIRFFHAYYIPDEILNKFILSQLFFEWSSSDIWGQTIGRESKESETEFKSKSEQLKNNKTYEELKKIKKEDHLSESNIIGYFMCFDITKNNRRIDKMENEEDRDKIINKVGFKGV